MGRVGVGVEVRVWVRMGRPPHTEFVLVSSLLDPTTNNLQAINWWLPSASAHVFCPHWGDSLKNGILL